MRSFEKSEVNKEDIITIISFNVLTSNQNKESVLKFIESNIKNKNKVIVLLMEINKDWSQALIALSDNLKNNLVLPREDNSGIGIWSNIPDLKISSEEYLFENSSMPFLKGSFRFKSKNYNFFDIHPLPPSSNFGLKQRNSMLLNIKSRIESINSRTFIMGDFNTTPWSSIFRQNFSSFNRFPQGLLSANTWSPFRNRIIGIPIDYILTTDNFRLLDNSFIGEGFGSDHRPLVASFELR